MTRAWTFLCHPREEPSPGDLAVSARGTRVAFADGLEATCMTSGLWNVPLGYGREEIADAVARALRDASYLTLFRRSHVYAHEAAERLIEFTRMPFSRALFATSGGAAIDLTMKLVRHYWGMNGDARRVVVGLRGSYHGLTYGAHALSGDALAHNVYGIDARDVRHVPVDDAGEALTELFRREGGRIAAIAIEPVLGTGAVEVPPEFLAIVERMRAHYGVLVVADEVATGFGRTGHRFASSEWTNVPDALVMSKALTNGTCAASVVAVGERIASAFARHDSLLVHGETQAGTPASCAAILATLDVYESLDADALFAAVSDRLERVIGRLLADERVIRARGRGAFRAIDLAGPDGRHGEGAASGSSRERVLSLVERVRRRGILVHPSPRGLQLMPAAVSEAHDLDGVVPAIVGALDDEAAA